jgi:hypothetical protein
LSFAFFSFTRLYFSICRHLTSRVQETNQRRRRKTYSWVAMPEEKRSKVIVTEQKAQGSEAPKRVC